MNKQKNPNIKSLVFTAFFTAIIYLGIQAFRIPMPAAVGTPFLHFGHIFIMLAIICLGPLKATTAGVLGLIIFDVLNGYTHAIPNVFVSTIIKGLVIGHLYIALKKKAHGDIKKEYRFGIICALIYGILNIIVDFIWSVVELVIAGNTFGTAIYAELISIPATIINAVFTVIGITILYLPVTSAFKRIARL